MRISFGGYKKENREIVGYVESFTDMRLMMVDYLYNKNVSSHYMRFIFDPECWQIDYGSWGNFFWVDELPENAYEKFMNKYYQE